eukprot:TRINITY_DN5754_c0_g1_i2.p1 TRINITY_DN5754_c0_g1~~TRINITY_DN5754_c0_g1_i2.p1  ORF type:complete len:462 (-),score=126.08 TRINITY_DN5754_c0_g1_i2:22-1407(-)
MKFHKDLRDDEEIILPPTWNISSLKNMCIKKVFELVVESRGRTKLINVPGDINEAIMEKLMKEKFLTHETINSFTSSRMGQIIMDGYNLASNQLINQISKITSLVSLSLQKCTLISESGFGYLRELVNLKQLNVAECIFSDVSLLGIQRLTGLVSLSLANTKVTEAGIANILPNFKLLRFLDLSACNLSDTIFVAIVKLEELQALKLNQNRVQNVRFPKTNDLKFLDLSNTLVNNASMFYVSSLTKLTYLDLKGTLVENGGLIHMRKLTNLNSFFLPPRGKINQSGLVWLASLKNLNSLDLSSYQVENLDFLKDLNSLRELSLSGTQVGGSTLSNLQGKNLLTWLSLDNCKNIDDSSVVYLKDLLSIEDLGLSNCPLSNKCLGTLCDLVNLKKLNLQRTEIDNNGPPLLTSLKKLKLLDLRWTKVDNDGISSLTSLNINVRVTVVKPPPLENNDNNNDDNN